MLYALATGRVVVIDGGMGTELERAWTMRPGAGWRTLRITASCARSTRTTSAPDGIFIPNTFPTDRPALAAAGLGYRVEEAARRARGQPRDRPRAWREVGSGEEFGIDGHRYVVIPVGGGGTSEIWMERMGSQPAGGQASQNTHMTKCLGALRVTRPAQPSVQRLSSPSDGRQLRRPGAGRSSPRDANVRTLRRSASSKSSCQTWWSCGIACAGGKPRSASQRYHAAIAL
jgi:hypothetical protein